MPPPHPVACGSWVQNCTALAPAYDDMCSISLNFICYSNGIFVKQKNPGGIEMKKTRSLCTYVPVGTDMFIYTFHNTSCSKQKPMSIFIIFQNLRQPSSICVFLFFQDLGIQSYPRTSFPRPIKIRSGLRKLVLCPHCRLASWLLYKNI